MARRDYANPPAHYSQGVVTNPNGTTNFAVDTGALPAGLYECLLIIGGTVAASFSVQRRNAANSANVGTPFTVYSPANASAEIIFSVVLETNERLRVLPGAVTGDVCGNLVLERLT